MFRNQLGLAPATKTPAKALDPDDDAGMDALLTDPLAVARKQVRGPEPRRGATPLFLCRARRAAKEPLIPIHTTGGGGDHQG
eukprot:XP_001698078.1 predicted protein [Chlamydomonas reinhardtii]